MTCSQKEEVSDKKDNIIVEKSDKAWVVESAHNVCMDELKLLISRCVELEDKILTQKRRGFWKEG